MNPIIRQNKPQTGPPVDRFLASRGGVATLDRFGFLKPRDLNSQQEAIVTAGEFSKNRCLVILGGPGTGKTTVLNALAEREASLSTHRISLSAADYSSLIALAEAVFPTDQLTKWAPSGEDLYVYIDGLDEFELGIDQIAQMFDVQFAALPIDRVRLRLTCRTSAWTPSVEQSLRAYWGDGRVKVAELLPLTAADVQQTVEHAGIDFGKFRDLVESQGLGPLASVPLTLKLILDSWQAISRIKSRFTLFETACKAIVERTAGGSEDTEFVLSVSSRVAALMSFGDLKKSQGVEDIVQEAAGGIETIGGLAREVTPAAVRRALSCGLFSWQDKSIKFLHESIQEFLAAHYLLRRPVQFERVVELLTLSVEPGPKVYPEIAGVAAWYAGGNVKLFNMLLKSDPQVLLRGEATTGSSRLRAKVVEALLSMIESELLTDSDISLRSSYGQLDHPELSTQLGPYIKDKSKSVVVRRVAIDIAEKCKAGERLSSVLAGVALDAEDDYYVRCQAAHAVSVAGDAKAKLRMRALINLEASEDPDDELKGAALRSLWPQHISGAELFGCLTPPHREMFFGSYQMFLRHDLAQMMQESDLMGGLDWAGTRDADSTDDSSIEELTSSILRRAAARLDEPMIETKFALAAWKRLKAHQGLFGDGRRQSLLIDPASEPDGESERTSILSSLVNHIAEPADLEFLVFSEPSIARIEDIPLALGRAESGYPIDARELWLSLAVLLFRRGGGRFLDDVLQAASSSERIGKAFEQTVAPVGIDSAQAAEARATLAKWSGLTKRPEPKRLDPPPHVRVLALLDRLESGDIEAWWQLNREMTLTESSTHYGDELNADLTKSSGWAIADDGTRQQIVHFAKRYLQDRTAQPELWLDEGSFFRPAAAGYRALILLYKVDREFVESLDKKTWENWAPAVIDNPFTVLAEDDGVQKIITGLAYSSAQGAFLNVLSQVIRRDAASGSRISALDKIEALLDERLSTLLLSHVRLSLVSPTAASQIFEMLVGAKYAPAMNYVDEVLRGSQRIDGEADEICRRIAASTILAGGALGWRTVWRHLRQSADLGKQVISSVAHNLQFRHAGGIANELSEEELCDVYLWLLRLFPRETDPQHGGGSYFITERDSVTDFRENLLRRLVARGTGQAIAEIERIRKVRPDHDSLWWHLAQARLQRLAAAWQPLSSRLLLAKLGID